MRSKWYELKDGAIKLRKRGFSIGEIERRLGIRRSTLSGWFKDIKLSPKQKQALHQKWKKALVKARKKAVLWHNAEKQKRLNRANEEALQTLNSIDVNEQYILELTLAILYLGEGTKKTEETAMGSSDPLILKFFLTILKNVYNVDTRKIRCDLGLRADQDPQKMTRFWARELKLPLSSFKRINIDKRTVGSKTYPHYKGVCQIRLGDVAIQRKLLYLSSLFCQKVIDNNRRSPPIQ